VIVDRSVAQPVGPTGLSPRAGVPADRCPFPRPFPVDFGGCAAHQAVAFVPTDTLHHPLRTELTCRHLTTGSGSGSAGRYYARCGLGGPPERLRWLAVVTPPRLAVMRALQEELDAAVAPQRDALLRAKAGQLAALDPARAREALETAVRSFLTATASFLLEREERFADVGLPVAPLLRQVEELCWAWARTRPVPLASPEAAGQAFPPVAQAFLQPLVEASWRERELLGRPAWRGAAPAPVATALLDTPSLRVTRRPGGGVSLHGELDARNADLLGAALEAALGGEGEQHVDASGLLFCSLSGLRALVRTAQRLGPAARLVVGGMPEPLRRAMELAGWADTGSMIVTAGVQAA
jgi:anti-anti-sigma regulatory factor